MDQKTLKEWEYRCIQEEPPWCTAACPLHVDARALAGHTGEGRWTDAWKVLRKHMPLPNILGRICDAPCEARCKRGQAGGAIRIGALERACIATEAPPVRILPLPAKHKRIAIAGGGLSGLTAAWDLARKGYAVTVFEAGDVPGSALQQYDPLRLPAEAIAAETNLLSHLGVRFELGSDPADRALAERCLNDFDAAYLGLDAVDGQAWDAVRGADGMIKVDAKTGGTGREALFAGGQSVSPVWRVAQGRWAATSIDRFLQRVSITAGRENDGPFETRLFTSLADVRSQPASPMADEKKGYTSAEAQAEARRCLQCECMECVKVCVYLEKFRGYPKKYAREIYNNLSIVIGEHPANKLINSCSLCGLCEHVCPNDFAMQDLCLQARQTMVDNKKMPPSAHEFALLDMAFSRSERFALARHQPGCETSTYAFFPGCQLCASAPGQVESVYSHLRSTLRDEIGLILGCCGAPAQWAGQRSRFDDQAAHINAQWEQLGQPRLILACSSCLQIFKKHLPMIATDPLWSILAAHPPAASASATSRPLAVHDPCTARYEDELRDGVRQLTKQAGIAVEELALGRDNTECCGFGGLMRNANPDLAGEVVRRRADRSDTDYLAYCAMCRDNLAAAGKRVVHLLDLFFPDSRQEDPALRPRPDWTRRQENRARLKARLMKQLWNEVPDNMEPHQSIKLDIAPEVAERLDQRRILVEDVQRVIEHAEATGERLIHPQSGHYKAAYAPFKVTFWVEYSPAQEGYVVHNAYAHRMEVLGP